MPATYDYTGAVNYTDVINQSSDNFDDLTVGAGKHFFASFVMVIHFRQVRVSSKRLLIPLLGQGIP